jgi:hypothetical protein
MSIKCNKRLWNGPSVHEIYKHLPLQYRLKFTKNWIFGLKTNHLANLVHCRPIWSFQPWHLTLLWPVGSRVWNFLSGCAHTHVV